MGILRATRAHFIQLWANERAGGLEPVARGRTAPWRTLAQTLERTPLESTPLGRPSTSPVMSAKSSTQRSSTEPRVRKEGRYRSDSLCLRSVSKVRASRRVLNPMPEIHSVSALEFHRRSEDFGQLVLSCENPTQESTNLRREETMWRWRMICGMQGVGRH